MKQNLIEKDQKSIEKRRKIFRVVGIAGSIVVGICGLLMILTDDFSFEVLLLFLFCLLMAIMSKKK